MTELQSKLLDMLKWIDTFCKENGIRYFLIGGTMLGAERHGGFIPWDDDIDIGMPRKDYDRFIELFPNEKINKYMLETPDTPAKDYCYRFCKFYDTTTTFVENYKNAVKRGIYIDIFPLDGIGSTEAEAIKNYKRIDRLYNLLLARTINTRNGRSFYKNLAIVVLRLVPEFILNTKKLIKKSDKMCRKFDYDNSEWVGNLVGAWRYKELMPRNNFGKPTEIKFENLTVFGVEKPDEYLTHLYGDWRKLPPIEKQITHHDFVLCDLNKSYLEGEKVNV